MKNNPRYILVHCTDTPYKKGVSQFHAVNEYHKSGHPQSPFPISSIGYHGGYHKIITNGFSLRYRVDSDPGAHCNSVVDGVSMNYQSLSLAIGFDGDREYPPALETQLAVQDIKDWQKKYSIPNDRVLFHRDFNTLKTCPGSLITREWLVEKMGWRTTPKSENITPAQKRATERMIEALQRKVARLLKKLSK